MSRKLTEIRRDAIKTRRKKKRGAPMANVIHIRDFNDPALDVYARLTEAQLLNRHCLKEGLFIAESPKVINRALDAGYEPV